MSARELDLLRAVDVGEEAETEALRVGRVAEAVDGERGLRRVERLAYARVQLVVGDAAPVLRLLVRHRLRLHYSNNGNTRTSTMAVMTSTIAT